jgi:sarcosine oxidase subunit gamma
VLERRSAIQAALAKGGRDGASGKRACRLGEIRGWSLLQVAGFPETMSAVETVLTHQLGAMPPERIGKAVVAGPRMMLRTGPEQIWIVNGEVENLASSLDADIDGATGALTFLSHSRSRIFIEGEAAREILAKGIAVDLDPSALAVNDFALTGLHHTPVLLLRSGTERYEIWAMRTFALTIWEWLADAAWPAGYDVEPPRSSAA